MIKTFYITLVNDEQIEFSGSMSAQEALQVIGMILIEQGRKMEQQKEEDTGDEDT